MALLKQRLKRKFDIKSKQDLEVVKYYLTHGTWGSAGCPFEIEDPYVSIPDMIKDKITRHFLKVGV